MDRRWLPTGGWDGRKVKTDGRNPAETNLKKGKDRYTMAKKPQRTTAITTAPVPPPTATTSTTAPTNTTTATSAAGAGAMIGDVPPTGGGTGTEGENFQPAAPERRSGRSSAARLDFTPIARGARWALQ